MIEVVGLTKRYIVRVYRGLFRSSKQTMYALNGVDLGVARGELYGLLGPNGAGKTTLLKCLTTLVLPTSGTIRVNGFRLADQEAQVRASLGCMLMGERGLYWKLTGRENLRYFAVLYLLPAHERERRIRWLIDRLRLADFVDRAVESYSAGQRMKIAFARALIHDAPILILDEPTNALDVHSAHDLYALVRELHAEGRTIIYTTHIMSEADRLCDRIAIMDGGRVLALGTPGQLKRGVAQVHATRVHGRFSDSAVAALRVLPGVRSVAVDRAEAREVLVVQQEAQDMLGVIIHTLYEGGAVIDDVSPGQATLDDVFLALTGRSLSEDTAVCAVSPTE